MKFRSIKSRIIFMTIFCVSVVTIVSNIWISQYLNRIILEKAQKIEQLNIETIQDQLNSRLHDAYYLGLICADDDEITAAINLPQQDAKFMRSALQAQELLNSYMRTCTVERYANKLFVFNQNLDIIQSSVHLRGALQDAYNASVSSTYSEYLLSSRSRPFWKVAPSLENPEKYAIVFISEMQGVGQKDQNAFLYLEFDFALLREVLFPYSEAQNLFLASSDGKTILLSKLPFSFDAKEMTASSQTISEDGRNYLLTSVKLNGIDLSLYSYTDITAFSNIEATIFFILPAVFITCLGVGLGIAFISTNYITRPIQRIIYRIQRISGNDFSYDPSIEASNDEMGKIGKMLNEMTSSVQNLLNENERMYKQRQQIETSLLQSQINPHFLYNTLDSIYWMAIIQKSDSIASSIHSLSNLLRNVAKGTDDKITLEQELELLDNYVEIQMNRYLGTFILQNNISKEFFSYRILKLTLQPLVENAIFHGIEPTGRFGTITLSAKEDHSSLFLIVEDDGVGIEPTLCSRLLETRTEVSKRGFNGIGLYNVHQRLQLVYGKDFGLSIESELGHYTRIIVHLPKEM